MRTQMGEALQVQALVNCTNVRLSGSELHHTEFKLAVDPAQKVWDTAGIKMIQDVMKHG